MLIMLAGVLVYTLLKKDWGSISTYKKLSPLKYIGFFLLIFAIGFYDGFLGPGTGSFLIFAFLMIGFDFLKAAGNAKFLNFGSNIGGISDVYVFRSNQLCIWFNHGSSSSVRSYLWVEICHKTR